MQAVEIPKGWKWVKLGEILTVSSGKGIRVNSLQGGNHSVYGGNGLNGYHSEYFIEEPKLIIGRVGVKCGVTHITKPKSWVTDNALIVEPKKDAFDINFLKLKLGFENLNKLSVSTAQPVISGSKIYAYDVLLPPKDIQQLIVSKIEELFSELDKGIENLRIALQQLKTYRQAVLNSLVSGEKLQTIENIIEKLDQGWSPKCENESSKVNNEWAVIKTSAVQKGKFLEFENKILPKELKPRTQHELRVGDILITRAGPRVRVGICCMIKKTRPRLINCDKVYRIKVNENKITPEYFEFILNTPKYQDQIEKMKSGISDSGLNLTQRVFLQIEIPTPSIEEQKRKVQLIESRLSVADKMEEGIIQGLQQAEALRQSILKKAFEGMLV